jgi:hypothetical protein
MAALHASVKSFPEGGSQLLAARELCSATASFTGKTNRINSSKNSIGLDRILLNYRILAIIKIEQSISFSF